MQDIKFHLNNLERNYKNLIALCEFLSENEYIVYREYMNKKYQNYIKSYKEIFDPQKEIKEDMTYFADVRTLVKYNEDIISGWLVEDFFLYIFSMPIFKANDFEFRIDSHDSDRIIKKERTFINSDPDFIVTHKNIEFKLEIQSLLIPYNKFHIKQNKATRLFSMTSFLYCLILTQKNIVFFNPDDIKDYGFLTKIKAFGGKDGYEYIIDKLPKNKILSNSNLDKKLLITLYWFYYYKKLGKDNFYLFKERTMRDIKDSTTLLNELKRGNN